VIDEGVDGLIILKYRFFMSMPQILGYTLHLDINYN